MNDKKLSPLTKKIFSIYDSKMEQYGTPFFVQTSGAALRMFMDAVNEASSPYNKHPSDFTLFELGEYNENEGTLQNHTSPKSLGLARDYIRKEEGLKSV